MKSDMTLILFISLALFCMAGSGCDYTDYGSEPLPQEDGDETPLNPPVDGDKGEQEQAAFSGATLDDPYEVTGNFEDQADDITAFGSAVTAAGCATTQKIRVIDGDDDSGEVANEMEAEVDEEQTTDGDLDAESETTVDGDDDQTTEADLDTMEAETEAENGNETEPDGDLDDELAPEVEEEVEIEVAEDYGDGPEMVFMVSMSQGDEIKATMEGDSVDGLIYMLSGNSASAGCSGLTDVVKGPGKESFSYVAVADSTIYLVLDTKAGATGSVSFTIELIKAQAGNPPEDGKIGAACAANGDCDSDYCLTSQVLMTLLQTSVDIPNGYCSDLGLFGTDCKESACNSETGGVCMDGGFMGPDYENMVKICVRPCDTNGDCRIEDSNVCVDPQDWVDQGLLDNATKDEYFADLKFCLPSAFVDVMEEELSLQQ